MAQVSRKRHPPVPGKTPTQPALPSMTRNQASNPSGHDQTLQNNSTSFSTQSLIEESKNGHAGGIFKKAIEILHAEEHGNGVEPGGHKANGYGSHDRDGNHFFGAMDFFGEMCGTVEAGKGVVGIDQAHDESLELVNWKK